MRAGAWAKVSAQDRLLLRREISDEGCWLYTGRVLARTGYAYMGYEGHTHVAVHVIAHREWIGPIPGGFHVDHRCHDPQTCQGGPTCPHRRCFNPEHLRAVPALENITRSNSLTVRYAERTHCLHGHELTEDNIYRQPSRPNTRNCLTCKKRTGREAYLRLKARQSTR